MEKIINICFISTKIRYHICYFSKSLLLLANSEYRSDRQVYQVLYKPMKVVDRGNNEQRVVGEGSKTSVMVFGE